MLSFMITSLVVFHSASFSASMIIYLYVFCLVLLLSYIPRNNGWYLLHCLPTFTVAYFPYQIIPTRLGSYNLKIYVQYVLPGIICDATCQKQGSSH